MTVPINLVSNPYYRGTKELDGNIYNLSIHWDITNAAWYMDLKGQTNDIDRKSIALRCGKDLLKRYGHIELGELWVVDNSGSNEDPNYDDIGSRFTVEYTPVV